MKRPLSLTLTAWGFIAVGLLSVWDMIDELFNGSFLFHVGIALIPIGYGLLKLRRAARSWALACIGLGWITLVVFIVFGFWGGELHFGNDRFRGWRRDFLWAGFCNAFGIVISWMTWVLLRRDIKELFHYSRG